MSNVTTGFSTPTALAKSPVIPYVGPRPFKENDKNFFFGREDEAECLLALLISKGLVVFYAPSGAGKSSLINARLFPGLEKLGYTHDEDDVRVRRYKPFRVARVGGGSLAEIASEEVSNIFTFNLIRSLTKSSKPPRALAQMTLTEFFQSSQGAHPPVYRVLIVDQFEQIFTHHQERWQEREAFFTQLQEAMQDDPSLLVLLALREDYLAGLDRYGEFFARGLKDRFRIERLREEEAIEVIEEPARVWHCAHLKLLPDDPKCAEAGLFEPGVAAELVKSLRQIKVPGSDEPQLGEFIEALQLQVVCHRLWKNLPGDFPRKITLDDICDHAQVEAALEDYYEETIDSVIEELREDQKPKRKAKLKTAASPTDLPVDIPDLKPEELRLWFGEKLITPTGIRDQVYEEKDAQGRSSAGGLPIYVVKKLVDKYLINSEEARSGTWYELSHDRFVAPIQKSNREWLLEEGTPLQNAAQDWDHWRGRLDAQGFFPKANFYRDYAEPFLDKHPKLQGSWYKRAISLVRQNSMSGSLYSGSQLKQAENWAESKPNSLGQLEKEFLAASRKAEDIRTRRNHYSLIILVVVFASIASYAVYNGWKAERQERIAASGQLKAIAHDVFTTSPERGLLLALEAVNQWPKGRGLENDALEMQDELSRAAQAGRLIHVLNAQQAVTSVAFAPDGNRFASAGEDKRVMLWDAITGQLLSELPRHPDKINAIAFQPAGTLLATACEDGIARLFDLSQGNRELRKLPRQRQRLLDVAFSFDGKRVATAGGDGLANVWDMIAVSDTPIQSFPHDNNAVNSVAFSPGSSQRLATASGDIARVWEWDRDTKKGRQVYPTTTYKITATTLAKLKGKIPDKDKENKLLEGLKTSTLYNASYENRESFKKALSDTLDKLVEPLDDQVGKYKATVLSFAQEKEGVAKLLAPSLVELNSVAFSNDGKYLATGGKDGLVRILDWQHNLQYGTLLHTDAVEKLAFAPPPVLGAGEMEGGSATARAEVRLVTASKSGVVKIWRGLSRQESMGRQEMVTLYAHNGGARAVAFSPTGKFIVTGGNDQTVKVWSAAVAHSAPVLDAAFSKNGRLATLDSNGVVIAWEASPPYQPLLHFYAGEAARKLSFSSNGLHLVIAGVAGWEIFNVNAGSSVSKLIPKGDIVDPAWAVAYQPSQESQQTLPRLVAGEADGAIQRWELYGEQQSAPEYYVDKALPIVSGSDQGHCCAHAGPINDLVFTQPDGQWLASASEDGYVKIWDQARNLKVKLRHPSPVKAVDFSADGKLVAAACAVFSEKGGAVLVWEWESSRQRWQLPHLDTVNDVAFSHNSRWIATAGANGVATVWDAHTGKKAIEFPAREGGLRSVAFSQDDKLLASVGDDKTVRLHFLEYRSPDLLALARAHLTLPWLPQDCELYFGRSCGDAPESVGVTAFIAGRRQALGNQWNEAENRFQQARQDYPILNLNPTEDVALIRTQAILARASNRLDTARNDDDSGLVEELVQAVKGLNPNPEKQQLQLLEFGEKSVRRGKIKNAILVYREAEKIVSPQPIPAVFWNNLCWFASLWSISTPPDDYIEFACNNATAEIGNKNYLDSRGVNRALRGDVDGAIKDFEQYAEYTQQNNNIDEAAQRRRWIELLKKSGQRAFLYPDESLKKEFRILRGQ